MRKLPAAIALALALSAIATPANATVQRQTGAIDAVLAASPGLLDAPANVSHARTNGHAIRAKIERDGQVQPVKVTLPVSPTDSISVENGLTVSIGLPFARIASAAVTEGDGIVSYRNNNGSSTVAAVRSNGSVQVSTVIDGYEAPTRYTYQLNIPDGGSLIPDGAGARVLSADGDVLGVFAAPWARDANGVAVPTRYEIVGSTLTQVVEHNSSFAYPVVADPTYNYTFYYSKADVQRMWEALNNLNNICRFLPLPYLASLGCTAPASLADAISSAHYQNKRIKAVYHDCGMNWCSTYTYYVVA